MTRNEAFAHLSGVRDELEAAKFATERLLRATAAGADDLLHATYPVKPSHVRTCAANLEATYILRLFSGFEMILRNYLAVARGGRRRRTRMEIVIDRVAVACNMPSGILVDAHAVREHRNTIVHDLASARELTFGDCKSKLGTFLSFLPVRW